jgi:hypothetical protein
LNASQQQKTGPKKCKKYISFLEKKCLLGKNENFEKNHTYTQQKTKQPFVLALAQFPTLEPKLHPSHRHTQKEYIQISGKNKKNSFLKTMHLTKK